MIVLVLNSGSSSLKFQLLDLNEDAVMAKGLVERIGEENAAFALKTYPEGEEVKAERTLAVANHTEAVQIVIDALTEEGQGVLKDLNEIDGIGQRVVQGGEDITDSVVIDEAVIGQIKRASEMAPLHNPAALAAIEACQEIMPDIPQVGVFDTSFHSSRDKAHYSYAIRYEDAEKYRIRRYGFHGISHKYVAQRCSELMSRPEEDLRIITCHMGNGVSVTAVNGGESVDTSMGFTPLSGAVMGTRVGEIDAAAALFLMEKTGMDIAEMDAYLNKECGILGVSGVSNDFRDLEEAMDAGDERAKLAYDMFILSVRKLIGSYLVEMNGAHAIVFTAGIGENDDRVRRDICADLDWFGIELDEELNKGNREESEISGLDSKVRLFIIPTNEEMGIAREARLLLGDELRQE